MSYQFDTISAIIDRSVLFATVSNPPCNILSIKMLMELTRLGITSATDDNVRVIVLQSDNPDFFIAHFDASVLVDQPPGPLPKEAIFHTLGASFRNNPKPSLVKIANRAGGGGCEIGSSCDMRFGVRGNSILNQMEVPLGILPGGTGSQNLPRLMGRGRALEMILGADDIDAETAEKWGYFNRIFDTTDAMNTFVDALAYRIAKWPPHAVALAKESVNNSDDLSWQGGLKEEFLLVNRAKLDPITNQLLRKFLDLGGQTPEAEKRMGQLCVEVADAVAREQSSS
ncbi:MAG: enoyl-CoA hydratase/isomerase family protein [Gammaproteobacteria bacterium]|nr:enoyl-CoA hydratase/isomerase family protein [Gammaproteobacteria bacterium]